VLSSTQRLAHSTSLIPIAGRLQAARLEELRAAAAAAAGEGEGGAGEDEGEGEGGAAAEPPPEPTLDEPAVDVEAEVAAAVAAIAKPEPKPVTDGDVLSALMDRGAVTRDALVQALAIHALGGQAYTQLFTPPAAEAPAA
jgi:radial spoke head protein 3